MPGFRPSVVELLRTRKATLTDSGSIKSIPDVRGILATLEVVGVKVLTNSMESTAHLFDSECSSRCCSQACSRGS